LFLFCQPLWTIGKYPVKIKIVPQIHPNNIWGIKMIYLSKDLLNTLINCPIIPCLRCVQGDCAKITLKMVGRVQWLHGLDECTEWTCLGRKEKILVGWLCSLINSSTVDTYYKFLWILVVSSLPQILQGYYCTNSINSSHPVTCDQHDKILVSSHHWGRCDWQKISSKYRSIWGEG